MNLLLRIFAAFALALFGAVCFAQDQDAVTAIVLPFGPWITGMLLLIALAALAGLMGSMFHIKGMEYSEVKINFLIGLAIISTFLLVGPSVGVPVSAHIVSMFIGGVLARFGDLFGSPKASAAK